MQQPIDRTEATEAYSPGNGMPPVSRHVKRLYEAAKILPAILSAVFAVLFNWLNFSPIDYNVPKSIFEFFFGLPYRSFLTSERGLPMFAVQLILYGTITAALLFTFSPNAKWRVSRKYHLPFPAIALSAAEYAFSFAWGIYLFLNFKTDITCSMIVIPLLFACFTFAAVLMQYVTGKKYPQLLTAEDPELETLRDNYYYGGKNHAQV